MPRFPDLGGEAPQKRCEKRNPSSVIGEAMNRVGRWKHRGRKVHGTIFSIEGPSKPIKINQPMYQLHEHLRF